MKKTELRCQYLTGDNVVKIYLVPQRSSRFQIRMKKYSKKLIRFCILLTLTALITVPIAMILIEAVGRMRGYDAFGSEYFFVALMSYGIFKYLVYFFNHKGK